MSDDQIEEHLVQIYERLERLERLAYVSFDDIRRVAEYAYTLAVRPPAQPGDRPVRRMSHMRPLSEAEAARGGLDIQRQVVMKSIWKALGFGIRHDVLVIAKALADRIMAKAGESDAVGSGDDAAPSRVSSDLSRPVADASSRH